MNNNNDGHDDGHYDHDHVLLYKMWCDGGEEQRKGERRGGYYLRGGW